jgi:photosystem II stability/assembly factor-like uncharacterized protein
MSVARIGTISVLVAALAVSCPAALQAQWTPDLFRALRPRNIGPAGMSGRGTSADVDPGDKNRIFVGGAAGGVWRSTDGGVTWKPVFDAMPVQSVGDIGISRANTDLVWVGTGEDNLRQSVSFGRGVFKSIDGGDTWAFSGLPNAERVSKVIPHPSDPQIAYAGGMGRLWSDGGDTGLFRTTDQGKSWQRMLYVNERTGAADVAMDPRNPDKLLVAMYEARRTPWVFQSGGPGSGLYLTRDGGETWQKLGEAEGMPAGPLGRIGIAFSASSPNVVYALVEAPQSALLRSDDGGTTWRTVNNQRGISPRPNYYSEIRVDPQNENRIYRISGSLDVSEDAGRTWRTTVESDIIHGDVHELWIDPDDPRHLIQGNDGGYAISYNRGDTWRFVENLPLSQFYQVSVDNAVPFNVYGGVQDSGSWYGPSNVWDSRGIINAHWRRIGCCDGFASMVDFSNPRYGYTTSQNGNLTRFDKLTMEIRPIRPPTPPGDTLRWNWNAAMAVDAFDSTTIYFGSQYVHRSRDHGKTWEIISPDLTTDDPRKQIQPQGPIPGGTERDAHTTILAIDTSPLERGVIWVTTDDGNVQITRDGGATWNSVGTRLPPQAPDSAYVPEVKASRHVPGRAYVAVDNHRRGDFGTYVYRTEAFGERWEQVPVAGVDGFLHEVEEDPVEPNLLFLGSETGLFVSLDRGASWLPWLGNGLPAAPVREAIVHPRDGDLVIGTHGRGIWILDDVTPLRALARDPTIRDRPVQLFAPPPAQQHQVAMEGDLGIHVGYRVVGHALYFADKRPYGALLSYWVAADGGEAARAQITVRAADGSVVRELEGSAHRGVNRAVWDLRRNPAPRPAGAPALPGEEPGQAGPRPEEVTPGTYQVTVRVGTQESTASVEVREDPRKAGVDFFGGGRPPTNGDR